jgi:hypothetical protein
VQILSAYRLESEKLLHPANQVDPFHKVKTGISKTVALSDAILKNQNMLADLIVWS